MTTSDLEIYKVAYVLVREMHRVRIKMPKALKHDIGQEMMNAGFKVIRGIVVASRTTGDKSEAIREFLTEGEVLWTWLRLAYDFGALSQGELRLLSERLNDLTKQGAAWMKWSKGKPPPSSPPNRPAIRPDRNLAFKGGAANETS